MIGVRVNVDLDTRTGGNGDRLLSSTKLVATDVTASHIANEAIVLPVLRLADCRPGRITIDDRKGVYELLVSDVERHAFVS